MKFSILSSIIFILLVSGVFAADIWTADINGNLQYDYSPNEIVYIHGNGFLHYSSVDLAIIRPNGLVDYGSTVSDGSGEIYTLYNETLMVGNYTITAFDGINYAETTFTDAAIWSTRNDCGNSTQDANQFDIGSVVHINGDGFSQGGYSWEITGNPGGASCDPNIVVASGNYIVDSSGAFCISAYLIENDDCGVYQIKFSNKGDNYNVDEGSCTDNSNCGEPWSEVTCVNSTKINTTVTPTCTSNECQNITTVDLLETCIYGCDGNECLVPVCNNGIIEGNEECDDGNGNDFDGCSNSCILTYCGDSEIQSPDSQGFYEECDDGNTDDGDGCSSVCADEYCGDGIDNNGNEEECDDGNLDNTDSCIDTCIAAACGDGFLYSDNEECDDGNVVDDDACSNLCENNYCGDSVTNNGEACDDGNTDNNDSCRNDCTFPVCGDGYINPEEECDDANSAEGDGCNECTLEFCGDFITNDVTEECDDGANEDDTDGCFDDCTKTYCGDLIVQDTNGDGNEEECDDGNTDDFDSCSNSCITNYCGDGIVNNGEDCEGNQTNSCDFGGYLGNWTCNTVTCTIGQCIPFEYCGDSIINGNEECDDGLNGSQTCSDECTVIEAETYCGDGIVDENEDCEYDEDCSEGYTCNSSCACVQIEEEPYCGDGIINQEAEECDDGNTENEDGCSEICELEGYGSPVMPAAMLMILFMALLVIGMRR